MVDFPFFLPTLWEVLGVIAALNLAALALLLRRVRVAYLQASIPWFLLAAPVGPLAVVTELLVTGIVTGVAFAAFGSVLAGAVYLGLTALLFLGLGSLRTQLLAAGLTALVRGPEPARNVLLFFDMLRAHWRRRRVLTALASGAVVCAVDLAAIAVLLGAFSSLRTLEAISLAMAMRTVGSLLVLPLTLSGAPVVVADGAENEQPVAWPEDLAA